jgi:site-specific DNA recombinase
MLNTNFNTTPVPQPTLAYIEMVRELEHSRQVDLNYLELLHRPYTIRVAIYLRVSTIKQAEEKKVSLPEQESAILQVVKSHSDWQIVATYNEGGNSGKEMETREQFKAMESDAIQGKFDLIVGWSTDRMARNMEEMTAFRKQMRDYGVQITTVMEPTNVSDPRTLSLDFKSKDKIISLLLDWKAEADNETRVARFNLGKIGKAKRGVNPCKVPYGFRKKIEYENGDPDKKQEVDVVVEKEALVVKMIFDYYDHSDWGFRRIAEELNSRNILSPNLGLWGYSTIKYFLQNPTYTGLVRWGWRLSDSKKSRTRLRQGHEGIIAPGKHRPIISPEQFQRVQDKIAVRARLGGRAIHSPGLLSGLIYCGRCQGHGYLSIGKQSKSSSAWAAYLCSQYAQYGKTGCTSRYLISKKKVESAVVQKIRELAASTEAQEEFIRQNQSNKKNDIKAQIKVLEKETKRIEKDRSRITNLLATTDFDEKIISDFKDKLTKLDIQEISKTKELEKLKITLENETKSENVTRETILSLMDFDKIWENADIYKKKMLLASLIKKIVVSNDKDIYIEFNHQS